MTSEILAKIERLAIREIGIEPRSLPLSPLTEAEVQHLFTLTRKLVERVPRIDFAQYTLINFYCDWSLHSKIDRSEAGSKILARIHDIIFSHLKKPDNSSLASGLTAALSFDVARTELNRLISWHGGRAEIFTKAIWDNEVLPNLVEIISQSPLRIGPRFAAIQKKIKETPLKGTSIVEELALIKIPSRTFNPKASEDEVTFCMRISTTDTTKFVVPLMR
ncbi:MAG: hypothetical protein WC081_03475 [Candidatus Ratteibacteria bacterium]|jgi:hypothetical protein